MTLAGDHVCCPDEYLEPVTSDEIKHILSRANQRSGRICVTGTGRAGGQCTCGVDFVISLRRMSSLVQITRDPCTVTVAAGISVRTFLRILSEQGLALGMLCPDSNGSIGGVVSMANHCTGAKWGVLSSYVESFELMKPNGEVIKVRHGSDDIFRVAGVGLGALGILLNITLKCEPAFTLETRQFPLPLFEVLESLNVHVSSSDHFNFSWIPHGGAVVRHAKRTNFVLYKIVYRTPRHLVGHRDTIPCPKLPDSSSGQSVEWFVARDWAPAAILDLTSTIETSKMPVIRVDVTFVKEDDFCLSPAYGRETCSITIRFIRQGNEKARWYSTIEQVMKEYGGRPSWRTVQQIMTTSRDFLELYPRGSEFVQLKRFFDPNGIMMSPLTGLRLQRTDQVQ